jgi:hypothetical protein
MVVVGVVVVVASARWKSAQVSGEGNKVAPEFPKSGEQNVEAEI